MKKAVIGFVATQVQGDAIVEQLRRDGIAAADISVLLPDKRTVRDFTHEHHTKAPEGAVAGGSAGGIAGGVIAALVSVGAFAIPGIGPLIAAGPIVAALSGVGAGGVLGSIVGALVGSGVPEYEARFYEGRLRQGNLLIAVHTEDAETRRAVLETFKTMGVRHAQTQTEATVPRGARPLPAKH